MSFLYPYEETLKSPFGQVVKEDALRILERYRNDYPAKHGWIEIDAGITQDPTTGLWYAWRHHQKYE